MAIIFRCFDVITSKNFIKKKKWNTNFLTLSILEGVGDYVFSTTFNNTAYMMNVFAERCLAHLSKILTFHLLIEIGNN